MNASASRGVRAILAAAILSLAYSGTAAITHIVHISVDGLGAVYLSPYVARAPDQFPNFLRLQTEGASTYNARCDFFSSETIPNHTSMFTGRPVLQPEGFPDTVHHGYNQNFPGSGDTFHLSGNPAVPYKSSFFDVAHDHGLTTAFYANKTRLSICDRSYNQLNGALDLIDPDHGTDKIDAAVINDGPLITAVVDPLLQNLTSTSPANYSFIHLREPDLTGHNFNWGSDAYSNMVRTVDQQLGRILTTVKQNPILSNRTALVVTSDHGGGGVWPNGHFEPYHITNYTIPFFLWAPGVPAATDLYALFSNRQDPGTNRTDYTTIPQPIRNGDGANLALALLSLPPVPGSFMIPLLVGPRLFITREAGPVIKLTWRDPQNRFLLKSADSLVPPINWLTVPTDPDPTGVHTHRETNLQLPRFFRLQSN